MLRATVVRTTVGKLRGSVSSVISHGTEGASSIPAKQYNILLASSTPTDGIKVQSLSEVITLNGIKCKPAKTQKARVSIVHYSPVKSTIVHYSPL